MAGGIDDADPVTLGFGDVGEFSHAVKRDIPGVLQAGENFALVIGGCVSYINQARVWIEDVNARCVDRVGDSCWGGYQSRIDAGDQLIGPEMDDEPVCLVVGQVGSGIAGRDGDNVGANGKSQFGALLRGAVVITSSSPALSGTYSRDPLEFNAMPLMKKKPVIVSITSNVTVLITSTTGLPGRFP